MDSLRNTSNSMKTHPEKESNETDENDNISPSTLATLGSTDGKDIVYLHGIRFLMLAALIGIMIFIVSVEANIAVTSLVAITHDLGGFQVVSWVISSYQLGFVALIVISASMSDICGRKPVTMVLILLFTVFSGGCAAAQNMTQLIILRAFQGLGGGGCYTLSAILIVDAVPPEKYGKYVAIAAIAIALGTVLGPIIGGAISENASWRWIFLFNVPVGALAFLLTMFVMPGGFPYSTPHQDQRSFRAVFTSIKQKIDILGCLLLLGAVLSFTACFQEADSRFPWRSAYVIVLLITSAILSTALLVWERYMTIQNGPRMPVLPWRFFKNRVMISIILVMALVGGPMSVTTFQQPQRFQLVNGLSSLDAGIRLLPFGALFPVGSMIGTRACSAFKIPSIYLILLGSALQVVGFALLSTLSASTHVENAVYGYLVICGLGCGMTFIMAYISIPFAVDERDKAVGMAAGNQFRTMGSAIGLAIAASVFNGYTLSRLASIGVNDPTSQLIAGSQALDIALKEEARRILSIGYNRQMLVLSGFSALQIPTALMMWKREQIIPS